MPDTSARLALPYLMPSQAQKHVTHNAALERLDVLVQPQVLDLAAVTPPAAPEEGESHVLGAGASGDWAGQDGMLASWSDAAWIFLEPQEGWQVLLLPETRLYALRGGTWQPVAGATQNLDGIGINAASDGINRLAVAADATLLSHDGAGHQLKINKAVAADTASLLFQTGWSGRAEMGLAGNDDWALKVSGDGSSWTTGLSVDAASGAVTAKKRFFSLTRSTNQTGIPHQSHTAVQFDTADSDAFGMGDLSTGRLTPPAGAISAIAGTYVTGLTAGGICTLGIWKNGGLLVQKIYYAAANGSIGMDVALADLCSGSDTYEVMLYVSTGATATANNNAANTYWRGFQH